jgi:hypothetical protein
MTGDPKQKLDWPINAAAWCVLVCGVATPCPETQGQ